MSEAYPTRKPYKPRRVPNRAHYDHETVHAILDEGLIAHLGYGGADGESMHVIPTYYARCGEEFLFHASSKSGLGLAAKAGRPMCATVTLVDGLIFARSGFHHSMNYRSVCLHGPSRLLTGADKLAALDFMVDRLEPGRASAVRPMNNQEIKGTHVVSITLDQVVAKVNAADTPNEEPEDLDWPVWAGIVPVMTIFGVGKQHEPALSDVGLPSLQGLMFQRKGVK